MGNKSKANLANFFLPVLTVSLPRCTHARFHNTRELVKSSKTEAVRQKLGESFLQKGVAIPLSCWAFLAPPSCLPGSRQSYTPIKSSPDRQSTVWISLLFFNRESSVRPWRSRVFHKQDGLQIRQTTSNEGPGNTAFGNAVMKPAHQQINETTAAHTDTALKSFWEVPSTEHCSENVSKFSKHFEMTIRPTQTGLFSHTHTHGHHFIAQKDDVKRKHDSRTSADHIWFCSFPERSRQKKNATIGRFRLQSNQVHDRQSTDCSHWTPPHSSSLLVGRYSFHLQEPGLQESAHRSHVC